MKQLIRCICVLFLTISLQGCVKQRLVKLPPVTEGWRKSSSIKNGYIVQKKDTLYSIAWAFGVDYRYLATINNLTSPYALRSGQHLRIAASPKSINKKYSTYQIKADREIFSAKSIKGWLWPTSGKIVSTFNNKSWGNKGLDIAGINGQPILASNHGKVVYSGTGIRSYGKLIIIKHNDDYLSAYAYNQKMLVEEGQSVKAGQKIATMGNDDAGHSRLHFEIRRFGKPDNPLLYLPRKP